MIETESKDVIINELNDKIDHINRLKLHINTQIDFINGKSAELIGHMDNDLSEFSDNLNSFGCIILLKDMLTQWRDYISCMINHVNTLSELEYFITRIETEIEINKI